MGCPAGMADTHAAHRHVAINLLLQLCQAANALFHADGIRLPIVYGNTGGIIATVLQLGQALNQKPCRLLVAYITNNTTHK